MRSIWLVPLVAIACGEVTTNGNDNPPPTIETASPARGGVPGGHTITLSGSGFTSHDAGDNYVVVGDVAATEVNAADDATLTFTLPAGPAPDAVVDVTVFNNNGFAVLPDAIQYSPYPLVTSLSQGFVRSSGDTISVFGAGFEALDAGDNVVTIGGQDATSVDVVSDTELEVDVAPRGDDIAPFTPLDVTVTNANGAATLAASFQYTKQGLLRFDWRRPNNGTTIYFIDVDGEEPQETLITTTTAQVDSATLSNSGLIYVTTAGPGWGFTRSLGILDPLTGAVQTVGAFSGEPSDSVRRLAFNNGVMYTMLRTNRQLAAIDLDDASYTAIGAASAYPVDMSGFGLPIAMTRRNDTTLWAAHSLQGTLYRVSTADSTAAAGPTLTGETNVGIYGMVQVDGDLYALTRGSAVNSLAGLSLVRIDTTTGAVEHLLQFGGVHLQLTPTPPLF